MLHGIVLLNSLELVAGKIVKTESLLSGSDVLLTYLYVDGCVGLFSLISE